MSKRINWIPCRVDSTEWTGSSFSHERGNYGGQVRVQISFSLPHALFVGSHLDRALRSMIGTELAIREVKP